MQTAAQGIQAQVAMPASPWWRHPMMWLVVGGPAVVVVAGFITLWLAARAPDPVLSVPKTAAAGQKDATSPAMQARNHVATPGK